MTSRSSAPARRAIAAAAIGLGTIAAIPSAASAAATNACDASALQASLLGSAPIEPVRANAASTPCAPDDRSVLDLPVLGLARVGALQATTTVAPGSQAVATTRVAGVRVGAEAAVRDLAVSKLLTGPSSIGGQIGDRVDGLLGPLRTGPLQRLLAGLPLIGGAQLRGVDDGALTGGLAGTLPAALASALPDVLGVGVLQSTAQATCRSGAGVLSGSSSVADLKVLGTAVDPNGAAGRVLSLDTADLQLGRLLSVEDVLKGVRIQTTGVLGTLLAGSNGGSTETSLFDLLHTKDAGVVGMLNSLLGGRTLGGLLSDLTTQIQPLLDQIRIQLPPGLLRATIDVNRQTVQGDQLTQQALAIALEVLGQPVLGVGAARARVGSGAPGCAPPAPPAAPKAEPPKAAPPKFPSPAAKEVLKCTTRPSQLIDVYGTRGRTFVQGVAQQRFVGRTAVVYLRHGGKRVGTAKVRKDGLFSTKVALPPAAIRDTNSARYFAVVGGRRTRALKFGRRMATTSITAKGRRVTFKGRVLGPRQARQRPIVIKQRITCKTYRAVARVMPDARGRFQVVVRAPARIGAGVYRAQTEVIKRQGSAKLFPTYTLPRVVGLD